MSDNSLAFNALIIALFLLISAFFSAAETSLTAVTRARLFQLVKDGNKRAIIASRLRKKKEALLSTVLLGNNAVNIAASALATALAIQVFGHEDHIVWLVTLVMTVLVVIFAEILPKTYAIQNAERVALALALPLAAIVKLCTPITYGVHILIGLLLRLFGVDISRAEALISPSDALRGVIDFHHSEGQMVKQERDMLGSILDLGHIEVREIMVHRKQADMIDAGLPVEDIIAQATSMLHSRVPLWRDNPDNVIGVLHVKDLVRILGSGAKLERGDILALAHKPWFIPESTSLRDQLLAFRARRQHFAVVVDEYGALLGIVTLEDIIEEIVGDIDDEHDEREAGDIQKAGKNVYFVSGDVTIRDLNREMDWNLPDENAATIAGLVMHEARDIPRKGQHFDALGFRFTVVDKTASQIKRLKIEKLAADKTAD